MNRAILTAGAMTLAGAGGQAAQAQDSGFTWEGEIEVGVDVVVQADDPIADLNDAYMKAEAAFEVALSHSISIFGGLTLEATTDATDDRAFEDLGLYVSEIGLRFNFGDTAVSVGKISPVFAVAWDATPGLYGTSLAEDYELSEMIGLSIETPIAATGGALSFAVFYKDDTGHSNSFGTKRGRNTVAAGGVGNTGQLNNVAIHYTQEFAATTAWIGARHLSAGVGDVSDETGVVIGATHDFGNGFDMIAEVARFNGAAGANDTATYATIGGAYALNDWTFSASTTLVDRGTGGADSLIALGVDRTITDDIEINFGVARFDVGGQHATNVGLAAVVSF